MDQQLHDDERPGPCHGASANTFRSIDLDPKALAALAFPDFVKALLDKTERLKCERAAFHDNLRKRYTDWANGVRDILAKLGAAAFLLTATAAALRFAGTTTQFKWLDGMDILAMLAALAVYAVMGTISFYEKGTDKTTAYFRQVATILAIRDLWTKAQFAFLKELRAADDAVAAAADATGKAAAQQAARDKLVAFAEAFCTDLDKVATGELGEFRTDFVASLTELDTVAKKGTDDLTKQLEDAAKAAQQAATAARDAAKVAADAIKPGALNVTVTGDFDDEVVISVDDADVARSRGKQIAIEKVSPGARKIRARAKKGTKELETSVMVDVKPGLQAVPIALA